MSNENKLKFKGELNSTEDFIYSSNPLVLDWKDWLCSISLVMAIGFLVPYLWQKFEYLTFEKDYRIQKINSQDYWLLQNIMSEASKQKKIAFIGDSAIWGHYVEKESTLTASLNKIERNDRFLNLGVSGLHSSALNGMIQYYGNNINNSNIIIQFAPLWIMNSKKDLSEPNIERGGDINHPKLLSQFLEKPPQYSADIENRLSICLARLFSVFSLTAHWTCQSTESKPFSQWVVQNPYSNPFLKINLNSNYESLPSENATDFRAWFDKPGLKQSNIPWISLNDSYQWSEFLKAVNILKLRNNKVFVYLGPFNKNMLSEESLIRYKNIQEESGKILSSEEISYRWAKDLKSEEYGDESHPLKAGYENLADDLIMAPEFINWLKGEK